MGVSASRMAGFGGVLHRWLFEAQPVQALVAARIVFGASIFFSHIARIPDALTLYGTQGLPGARWFPLLRTTMGNFSWDAPAARALEQVLPPISDTWILSLFGLLILSSLCFTVGLRTRLSGFVTLALEVLGARTEASALAARHAGIAWSLVGLLRARHGHGREGRVYLPQDLLAQAGLTGFEAAAEPDRDEVRGVCEKLGALAARHLGEARALRRRVPKAALPALLPARLAGLYLGRLRAAGYGPSRSGHRFSSNDYVGHLFGASSLEIEDNLARLDRTLADLFAYVDEKVGLANTLIVLSADHGQPETPGYLHELGIDKAHYFDTRTLDRTAAIAALKKQFGIGEELIEAYFHPYIYLNRDLIRDKGLDQGVVENAVAAEIKKFKGVAAAVSSTALRTASLPDTLLMRTILRNFHPKRSGDIYLVFEPDVFINDFDGLVVTSTHGSPWRYDTFVPIMFAGAGLSAAKVNRPVTPYDIASTLAAYLNVKPPSGAIGTPLSEVLVK